MSRVVLFLLIAIPLIAQETNLPGNQIITSEEISAAGIINISDILTLVNKWSTSTIDGFAWYLSPNNLSDYQRQDVIILVDSQKININFFDNINLNLLPFSVSRIAYVEIINSPAIINGEYASSGLIHFHLKEPAPKLTAHVSYANGNETGDPGPYKFTEFSSVNIDRINFLLSLDVDYRSKNWRLASGYKQEENYNSDENIKYRLLTSINSLEKAKTSSAYGKFKINFPVTNFNLLAFYTNTRDYLFFKPFGNEYPVRKLIYFGGVNGTASLSEKISMTYTFKVTDNRLADWQKMSMDWRLVNLSANIETKYNLDNIITSMGFGVDRYSVYTGYNLFDNSILLRKIYLTLNYSSGNFSQGINSFLTRNDAEYSFKNSLISSYRMNKNNSLHSIFSFSGSSLDDNMNYWTWFFRNYSPGLIRNIEYKVNGTINKLSQFTADIIHIYNIDSLIKIESGVLFRRNKGYIESQNFQLKDDYFVSPVELYPDAVLKSAGAYTGFEQKISGKLSYSLNYYYQRALGGDELYRELQESIPEHKGTLVLNYKPLDSFGIWARINYFSSIRWREYEYLRMQSENKFNNELKPGPLVDISIQKWFGNRLILLNLVFRNILNQKEIYHPAGAQFNFRFFLQLNINLDNLPE